MTYRSRQRLFSLIVAGPFYALIAVATWWIFTTDDPAAIGRRTALLMVPAAVMFTCLCYWPTRRRPAHLYHLTTCAAAGVATTAVHDDGTVTVALRPRRAGRATYFFPQPPARRADLYWNLRTEPDACIELHDIDYDGVQVRRRLTGAYRLRGLVAAGARIHPFPPEGSAAHAAETDLDRRPPPQ